MQEFASRKESSPAPPAGHWPSDEELAAYIDGNLGEAESRRITEHLADCEECYAVYAETLQFQLESEAAEGGKVVAFPSKEGMEKRWWYGIAALLALGIGGGWAYQALLSSPPALVTAEVTASMQGKPALTGNLWLGPTYRGGGDEGEEAPLDPASFQIGVQLVNLQVSLEAGQGEQAQDVVARILTILKDQMFVDDLKKGYTEITTAIANGTPPQQLAGKASELAQQAREAFDAPHLDFGQWVEAGQLAAAAGEPSFFERGDTRKFLRKLLWRQKLGIGEMKLEPAARQGLEDISEVLAKGNLGKSEYGELRQDLEKILDIYYPQS
jgi:Putative zinc-finger